MRDESTSRSWTLRTLPRTHNPLTYPTPESNFLESRQSHRTSAASRTSRRCGESESRKNSGPSWKSRTHRLMVRWNPWACTSSRLMQNLRSTGLGRRQRLRTPTPSSFRHWRKARPCPTAESHTASSFHTFGVGLFVSSISCTSQRLGVPRPWPRHRTRSTSSEPSPSPRTANRVPVSFGTTSTTCSVRTPRARIRAYALPGCATEYSRAPCVFGRPAAASRAARSDSASASVERILAFMLAPRIDSIDTRARSLARSR